MLSSAPLSTRPSQGPGNTAPKEEVEILGTDNAQSASPNTDRSPPRADHLNTSPRRSDPRTNAAIGMGNPRGDSGSPREACGSPLNEAVGRGRDGSDQQAELQHAAQFTRYRQLANKAKTCFVDSATPGDESHLGDSERDFSDRTIRFTVYQQTGRHAVDGEREMIVVSSPGNIPWILDTLAPPGSDRLIWVRCWNSEGEMAGEGSEQGLELLEHTLPLGLPFEICVVTAEGSLE